MVLVPARGDAVEPIVTVTRHRLGGRLAHLVRGRGRGRETIVTVARHRLGGRLAHLV